MTLTDTAFTLSRRAREARLYASRFDALLDEAPGGLGVTSLLQARADARTFADKADAAATDAKKEVARNTTQARLNRALRATRKEGVKVRQNVGGCCRGCITREDLGAQEGQPYAYTYGGQGSAYSWDWHGESAIYRSAQAWETSRKVDRLYFTHGDGAAPVLAATLREEGFEVEWNGDNAKAVIVILDNSRDEYAA